MTTPTSADPPRHAGVVGSPIAHSLSPVLHRAAYAALGLTGWSYHRAEVRSGELAAYLGSRPDDWVGVSVTMPGKEDALALARSASARAALVGAANTLVRTGPGWHAENTDVHGVTQALREAGYHGPPDVAVVVGSGATARAVLVALHEMGARQVRFVVREDVRPQTRALAGRLGLRVGLCRHHDPVAAWGSPDVVVSTVPRGRTPAVDGPGGLAHAVVLDVVYAGWPSPWAADLGSVGVRVHRGGSMLLHQAAGQVHLMTGRPPPLDAMRQALRVALGEER